MKFQELVNTKMLKNKDFSLCFKFYVAFIMLINGKMPNVGILPLP